MFLGQEEPWRIKNDPLKKGKIVSYSLHCLIAIAPSFAALNPGFHRDLNYLICKIFRPVKSIEESI